MWLDIKSFMWLHKFREGTIVYLCPERQKKLEGWRWDEGEGEEWSSTEDMSLRQRRGEEMCGKRQR